MIKLTERTWLLITRFAVCAVFLAVLTGCGTLVERGNSALNKGEYEKARACYLKAMDKEQKRCGVPRWDGSKYSYNVNAIYLSDAVRGAAESYRAQNMRDEALYCYFHYIQVCLRHGLNFSSNIDRIKAYVMEGGDKEDEKMFDDIIKTD